MSHLWTSGNSQRDLGLEAIAMLVRWLGQTNTALNFYVGNPKRDTVSVRLVTGHVAEIPDDDPDMQGWIQRAIFNGKLENMSSSPAIAITAEDEN